jgi:putative transposase
VARLPALLNSDRIWAAFERKVVADSAGQIDAAVRKLVEWVVDAELRVWQDVRVYLARRCQAGRDEVMLGSVTVSFFIDLGTRRIYVAGSARHPTSAWVAQLARQMVWPIQDGTLPIRLLRHDRDSTYYDAVDRVFASEGVEVIPTPYRAPHANAVAERWIRSAREECLDHLLIVHERHLLRVLTAYAACFNRRRSHQGLDQRCLLPLVGRPPQGDMPRRDIRGGTIRDYERQAACCSGFRMLRLPIRRP